LVHKIEVISASRRDIMKHIVVCMTLCAIACSDTVSLQVHASIDAATERNKTTDGAPSIKHLDAPQEVQRLPGPSLDIRLAPSVESHLVTHPGPCTIYYRLPLASPVERLTYESESLVLVELFMNEGSSQVIQSKAYTYDLWGHLSLIEKRHLSHNFRVKLVTEFFFDVKRGRIDEVTYDREADTYVDGVDYYSYDLDNRLIRIKSHERGDLVGWHEYIYTDGEHVPSRINSHSTGSSAVAWMEYSYNQHRVLTTFLRGVTDQPHSDQKGVLEYDEAYNLQRISVYSLNSNEPIALTVYTYECW
jgi:hypothetical protein